MRVTNYKAHIFYELLGTQKHSTEIKALECINSSNHNRILKNMVEDGILEAKTEKREFRRSNGVVIKRKAKIYTANNLIRLCYLKPFDEKVYLRVEDFEHYLDYSELSFKKSFLEMYFPNTYIFSYGVYDPILDKIVPLKDIKKTAKSKKIKDDYDLIMVFYYRFVLDSMRIFGYAKGNISYYEVDKNGFFKKPFSKNRVTIF